MCRLHNNGKQDSINGEVVLERLLVREDKRHYGVARKLLNHTLRTMRACGYKYAVAAPDNEAAERFLVKFGFEKRMTDPLYTE